MIPVLPQGPAVAGIDLANVITDLLPTLGATSLEDLTWCLPAELYQWSDEYAKRLAHRAGVFVERDTSNTIAAGTAAYPVPTGHVDTIHAALIDADGNVTRLRPSTVRDLVALDSTWPTTTGEPERYSMDAGGVGTITTYPNPVDAQDGWTLAIIFDQFPATIEEGSSTVAIASPIADYFQFGMLAEARRKQSEGAMPEMAAHFDERVSLYEQVITKYWGADE